MAFPQAQVAPTVIMPTRTGTSPIGTSSPNTGGTANTNSSYSVGANTSGINNQATITSYAVQDTDYGGFVVFNTSSAIGLTLNSSVKQNFTTSILNLGSGAITLTPTNGALVNGSASLALGSGVGVQVFFADGAWLAYSGATIIPVTPETIAGVAGKYLVSYNGTTGLFGVNATPGISATITTAALTSPGGTQGSMTFVGGILTAQTPAT